MLNRQKVLACLLEQAGRPVAKLELMKWCFLLRHETPSGGGSAFYQFLPYHFGPFSFCLYREIDQLVCSGIVDTVGNESWQIGKSDSTKTAVLTSVKQDVGGIVDRFCEKSTSQLMDYVYDTYPWFTINSKRKRHAVRPIAPPAVYTAGYEGLQIEAFLDMLLRNGILRLADVRNNPIARRYGFHKSTLNRLCQSVDIEYVHFPELGIPSALRHSLATQSDYESLFGKYEADVLTSQAAAVASLAGIMQVKPTVLVCMESNPSRCHRTRLAHAIAIKSQLPVRHLELAE